MKTIPAPATQAVYHDYVAAPDTYVPIKRMFAAVALDAPLDHRRLERAIHAVVDEHEILRTCPVTTDGQVVQEIRDLAEIDEPLLVKAEWDGTGAAISAIKDGLENRWARPRQTAILPILATSPNGTSYLLCAFNGCCLDGTSAHAVLDAVRAHYGGGPVGGPPMQFTDYYTEMAAEGQAACYDDWLRMIDRAAPALPDHLLAERDAAERAWIRVLPFELGPRATAAVDSLRRAYSCTRFETLAAAAGLYFRRDDGRPTSVGVLHGGRRGPRAFDVAGLLRTQVMDLVEIDHGQSAGEAFRTRVEGLRGRLRHEARLPVEDVCARAGLPGGFRLGERRLWEVSIVSRFSRFLTGEFGEARIGSVDAPMQDDFLCENGGPVFALNYSIRPGDITGGLQYVDPPINPALAADIVQGLQDMAVFLAADSAAPLASGPGLLQAVS